MRLHVDSCAFAARRMLIKSVNSGRNFPFPPKSESSVSRFLVCRSIDRLCQWLSGMIKRLAVIWCNIRPDGIPHKDAESFCVFAPRLCFLGRRGGKEGFFQVPAYFSLSSPLTLSPTLSRLPLLLIPSLSSLHPSSSITGQWGGRRGPPIPPPLALPQILGTYSSRKIYYAQYISVYLSFYLSIYLYLYGSVVSLCIYIFLSISISLSI